MVREELQERKPGNGLLGGCRSTKTLQRICQSRRIELSEILQPLISIERAVGRGSEVIKMVSWGVFSCYNTKKSQAFAKPHDSTENRPVNCFFQFCSFLTSSTTRNYFISSLMAPPSAWCIFLILLDDFTANQKSCQQVIPLQSLGKLVQVDCGQGQNHSR